MSMLTAPHTFWRKAKGLDWKALCGLVAKSKLLLYPSPSAVSLPPDWSLSYAPLWSCDLSKVQRQWSQWSEQGSSGFAVSHWQCYLSKLDLHFFAAVSSSVNGINNILFLVVLLWYLKWAWGQCRYLVKVAIFSSNYYLITISSRHSPAYRPAVWCTIISVLIWSQPIYLCSSDSSVLSLRFAFQQHGTTPNPITPPLE